MDNLPDEIKFTYIAAIIIMLSLVIFIIVVVLLYNKNQILYLQEKHLNVENKNQLLQKELERQKAIQAERERISHDMHDDLGAGISALKLQTEFLQQKVKNEPELQEDLEELLKTSADMNLSMRQMLWNLNKANDTVHNLAKYISSYAEHFFCKTNIQLSIQNQLPKTDIPISSDARWHLFLCMKEALNNIYKHSQASKVIIGFKQTESHFILDVKDDGIGLNATQHEGNGLQNMNFRMTECSGKFEIIPSPNGLHLRYFLPI